MARSTETGHVVLLHSPFPALDIRRFESRRADRSYPRFCPNAPLFGVLPRRGVD